MTSTDSDPPLKKLPASQEPQQTNTYSRKQLPYLLDSMHLKGLSAEIHIASNISPTPLKSLIILQRGDLAYCGSAPPTVDDYIALIKSKKSSDWFERITELSGELSVTRLSPRAFLSRLVSLRLFNEMELRALLYSALVLRLEPIMIPSGQFKVVPISDQGKFFKFRWSQVKTTLAKRERIWQKLSLFPDASINIPVITQVGITELEQLSDSPASSSAPSDYALSQFVKTWVDSSSPLFALGDRAKTDPILFARKLMPAYLRSWVKNAPRVPPSPLASAKILIVDSHDLTRKFMRHLLADYREVFQAQTSLNAIAFLNQNMVDLLILDVALTDINGIDLCRKLRKLDRFRALPILIMIPKDQVLQLDKIKGRMAGATGYISKPLNQSQVKGIVNYHLKSKSRSPQK